MDDDVLAEIPRPRMFMLWAADNKLFFRPEDEGIPAVAIEEGNHLTVDLHAGMGAYDGPVAVKFTIIHGTIAPVPNLRQRLQAGWRAFRA